MVLLTGLLKSLLSGSVGSPVATAMASYLPAKRAASVDPVIALRHDWAGGLGQSIRYERRLEATLAAAITTSDCGALDSVPDRWLAVA